ncbi:uncharacterized protein B0I36DRAFT_313565 [Microdochium trichocladiopsis]|uniref:MFS maltose permease n=1 Tax=Microdochium trichocladiopsis TaxID=1682393 RepID=A0A9P8YFV0_9PEZI|nr:uncharacterized protein B0I36DRAFT_313565 [Microdochium trichocladiopsis]KAH7037224.1 hypothetical protein B0I36DRAFT_313565 [Microdochium trichocladiopsis]
MERPVRIILRRLIQSRLARTANSKRTFVGPTRSSSSSRPQLPFLSVPQAKNEQFRYLTTERKQRIKYELLLGIKWGLTGWAIIGCCVIGFWSVQQDWLERYYPTPSDWKFLTRLRFRLMMWCPERKDTPIPDWSLTWEYAKNVVERLEDPAIDGAGVTELTEGGIWIGDVGNAGFDVTAKSEPWRRGYYQALMQLAKSAEYLDGCFTPKDRKEAFFADQLIGPSNPYPRPIYPGQSNPPREEDVVRIAPPPEEYYMKILTTRGFSTKQKIDAALAQASYLEYKSLPEAAANMYDWALSLATENIVPAALPFDQKTLVLRDGARNVSANVLEILTSIATLKAQNGDVPSALPILVSVLRARRSLPEADVFAAPAGPTLGSAMSWEHLSVPPAPDDGMSPPVRDAQELCEEAGLNLYIGEIVYTSNASAREEGVGWTREAVDAAQEQLHKLGPKTEDHKAQQRCRECLSTGLTNWAKMVDRLAKDELSKQAASEVKKQKSGSWLGLWSEGTKKDTAGDAGRWAAEAAVIKERSRRAQDLLEDLEAPGQGISAPFRA